MKKGKKTAKKKQGRDNTPAELLQQSFDHADFLRQLQKLARPVLFSREGKKK